jgi:hypothetical protein
MDMAPIPEDAEMSATTAAAMSPKLPHERYQPCRHGRNIIVAVDHGQESRRAFEWAITNLVHMADTLYLLHVLPTNYMQGRTDEASAVMQATEVLFDKLAKQAYEVAMVRSVLHLLSMRFVLSERILGIYGCTVCYQFLSMLDRTTCVWLDQFSQFSFHRFSYKEKKRILLGIFLLLSL